jgi:methionyl-tRNA formyltransferase
MLSVVENQLVCNCSDRLLALDEVQLEGRGRTGGIDFARGARIEFGRERLE